MRIKLFVDKVQLPEKRDVLKVHLYMKFLQYGIKPFDNDINIIVELYCFGGYSGKEEQKEFIDLCIDKKYMNNPQSVRNILSRYTILGVLDKPKNLILSVNESYIPKTECDRLFLQHTISHAEQSQDSIQDYIYQDGEERTSI